MLKKTLRPYHRYMSRDLWLMAWVLDDIQLFQSSVQCRHLAKKYIFSHWCFDVFERILNKSKNTATHKIAGCRLTSYRFMSNNLFYKRIKKFHYRIYFVKYLQIDGPTRYLENVAVTTLLELLHLLSRKLYLSICIP